MKKSVNFVVAVSCCVMSANAGVPMAPERVEMKVSHETFMPSSAVSRADDEVRPEGVEGNFMYHYVREGLQQTGQVDFTLTGFSDADGSWGIAIDKLNSFYVGENLISPTVLADYTSDDRIMGIFNGQKMFTSTLGDQLLDFYLYVVGLNDGDDGGDGLTVYTSPDMKLPFHHDYRGQLNLVSDYYEGMTVKGFVVGNHEQSAYYAADLYPGFCKVNAQSSYKWNGVEYQSNAYGQSDGEKLTMYFMPLCARWDYPVVFEIDRDNLAVRSAGCVVSEQVGENGSLEKAYLAEINDDNSLKNPDSADGVLTGRVSTDGKTVEFAAYTAVWKRADGVIVPSEIYIRNLVVTFEKPIWERFNGIECVGAGTGAVASTGDAEYYTLQGVRVAQPAPGSMVICRRGIEVTKVVVR